MQGRKNDPMSEVDVGFLKFPPNFEFWFEKTLYSFYRNTYIEPDLIISSLNSDTQLHCESDEAKTENSD